MTEFATRTMDYDVVGIRPTGRSNMGAAPVLREQLPGIVPGGISRELTNLNQVLRAYDSPDRAFDD